MKYRLVNTIRGYYNRNHSPDSVVKIETNDLVKALWDTGEDPELIRNKRKNLNSIKSTVNSDLTSLFKKNMNPEGIVINSRNIFDMSDEAKSEFLESIAVSKGENSLSIGKIADALRVVHEFLATHGMDSEDEAKYEQLKELVKEISGRIGLTEGDVVQGFLYPDGQKIEEDVEELDDEDLEEIEIEDVPEDEDDLEEIEIEEDVEELDDEDLEEIEIEDVPEDEDDPEEIEIEEDVEELDDEDLEEIEIEDVPGNAKILADEFDKNLSEMDRYYNQYILIPKGSYTVGSSETGKKGNYAEKKDLDAFYFGKFPVTNNLFEAFVEKTGYITTAEKKGFGIVYTGRCRRIIDREGIETVEWNSSTGCENIEGACWYQPNGPGSNLYGKRNHPVVQVSLEDAMSFAAWTGKRLPHEDEWEAAARTSKGYDYPWGNHFMEQSCNIESSFAGETTPVDQYESKGNSLGISDAMGNVLEWTCDKIMFSQVQSLNVLEYILKGGSWISGNSLKLDFRTSAEPGHTSNILGFRCVAY